MPHDTAETPRFLETRTVAKYWLGLTLVALLIHLRVHHAITLLVQAGLALLLLLYLTSRQPLVRVLAGLPRSKLRFLVVMLSLIVGGHLVGQSFKTFPFPLWNMYCGFGDEARNVYRYTAILDDGSERPLKPEDLNRVVGRSVVFQMKTIADSMERRRPGPDRDRCLRWYEDTLDRLAQQYEQRTGRSVRAVRVTQAELPLRDMAERPRIAGRPFWNLSRH